MPLLLLVLIIIIVMVLSLLDKKISIPQSYLIIITFRIYIGIIRLAVCVCVRVWVGVSVSVRENGLHYIASSEYFSLFCFLRLIMGGLGQCHVFIASQANERCIFVLYYNMNLSALAENRKFY